MAKYLTAFNLMVHLSPLCLLQMILNPFFLAQAYDFSGEWSDITGNQANLYGGTVSSSAAVKYYIAQGASPSQINLGLPLYGRGFTNTAGLGKSFNGVGTGTWESGVYDYWALPKTGGVVHEDTTSVSSYSYNPTAKELVSYDTPAIAGLKAKFIVDQGLAGAMFWVSLLSDLVRCVLILLSRNSRATRLAQLLSYPPSRLR